MECRVYRRFAPSLRAGMITEYMVVIVVGAHALFEEPVHDDGADVRREMLDNRLERQAQLRMSDEVVVNAIFDGVGIGDAVRASEAMHPAQPGQAQAAAAAAAELLVQIALLAAEAAKTRIEPRPGGCAARGQSESLHGNVERPGPRAFRARVESPDAPHAVAPYRIEVRGEVA